MARDASLDDFLGDDPDAGDVEDDDAGDGRGAVAEEADDANGVATGRKGADVAADPARATYDWSPAGAACGECGAVVERRWRNGEAMVCGECKEW